MASSKEYLEYVLDLLSEVSSISHRYMMSEYVLYYRGKVFGGIYDDRFLVKLTKSATEILSEAQRETPYDGAKDMLLVDTEDKDLIKRLVEAMYDELPEPKKKRG